MALTHGNVIFDILQHSAFQKYSICWVFRSLPCSNHFHMYFALQFFPLIAHVILLSDFRTIFVFALGPFIPVWVFYFDYNGDFNGKNNFLAIKSVRNVLQPSSQPCWATFLIFFSGLPHLPIFVAYGGQMAKNDQIWPKWPSDHMRQIWASEVSLKKTVKRQPSRANQMVVAPNRF